MAVSNVNNRPTHCQDLGNVNATGNHLLYHAVKKIAIKNAFLVALAAVTGTATNKLAFHLKKLDAAGTETDLTTNAVDNEGGVTKGDTLNLGIDNGYVVLEKGESLFVEVTKAGTGTWANCFAAIDYQVIGN